MERGQRAAALGQAGGVERGLDRSYLEDSLNSPPFLRRLWREMIAEVEARKHPPPE